MEHNAQSPVPTLRTCLQTCACDPPQFYVVSEANWGAGAWEADRLILHLEETDYGQALLAQPAALFEYPESDEEELQETVVATIFLIGEDGKVCQEDAASIKVYRIFSLAHFCAYVADPLTSLQYSAEKWKEWPPLLAYAAIAFGLTLEIVEYPLQVSYRRKGATAEAGFPLWAVLLHKLLGAIKGNDESFVESVDWEQTICALQPLLARLALHTDWPGTTACGLDIAGRG